jgi:hypothetical protein
LKWYKKIGGICRYKYDVVDTQQVEIGIIIFLVHLAYKPTQRVYVLDAGDEKIIKDFFKVYKKIT